MVVLCFHYYTVLTSWFYLSRMIHFTDTEVTSKYSEKSMGLKRMVGNSDAVTDISLVKLSVWILSGTLEEQKCSGQV